MKSPDEKYLPTTAMVTACFGFFVFCTKRPHALMSLSLVQGRCSTSQRCFEKDNFSKHLCEVLHLPCTKESDISAWGRFVQKTKKPKHAVTIAVVGKYFSSGDFILSDVYLSVLEAIKYSAYSLNAKPIIRYFSSLDFEKDPKKLNVLSEVDGILVPGGFGTTGIDGILATITYARTKKIPKP